MIHCEPNPHKDALCVSYDLIVKDSGLWSDNPMGRYSAAWTSANIEVFANARSMQDVVLWDVENQEYALVEVFSHLHTSVKSATCA